MASAGRIYGLGMTRNRSNGNGANGDGRGRLPQLRHAVRLRVTATGRDHDPAAIVRHAAAARRARRYRSGVVVFAAVREEQELLERLASLVERGKPLPAPLLAAVERLALETVPPRLPASLVELYRLLGAAPDEAVSSARAGNYAEGIRVAPDGTATEVKYDREDSHE